MLFQTEADVRVLRLLQATCAADFTMPSIASREGVVEVTWQDDVLPLPVLPADFVPQHLRQLQAALLCQLAHYTPTPEDLEPYAQSSSAVEASPLLADLIVLQNDEELLLPLFDLCRQIDVPIRTVAIRNTSAFGGVAHLLVQNADGQVIDHVRLGNGTTVYANCLGSRLIELLPQLSASSDTAITWIMPPRRHRCFAVGCSPMPPCQPIPPSCPRASPSSARTTNVVCWVSGKDNCLP